MQDVLQLHSLRGISRIVQSVERLDTSFRLQFCGSPLELEVIGALTDNQFRTLNNVREVTLSQVFANSGEINTWYAEWFENLPISNAA